MPDWFNHLHTSERDRVDKIDSLRRVLAAERALLQNRANQRKFRKQRRL